MPRFDAKAEMMVAILGSMNEKLASIDDKQDKTIEILKDVKEDTKYIPGIKDDTSKLLGKQDKAMEILDCVKQDTGEMTDTLTFLKAVHRETLLRIEEAVSQLISTPKIPPLFGFRALYAFLFHPILNCWTASEREI